MKKCPYCAEEIKDEAIVCRYCGRDIIQITSTSSYQPLNRGAADLEALKNMSLILESQLDKSQIGLQQVAIYLKEVVNRGNILVNTILAALDPLITKGRPSLFGRAQWDKEVSIYLIAINMQSIAIFGDDMINSVFEVPNGCGKIWFYFFKVYQEALEMVENITSEMTGKDRNGLKKGLKNRSNMNIQLHNLREEINTLESDLNALLSNRN